MRQGDIQQFLAGETFAVVGASRDRTKYGNKVLRTYLQHERTVYAVNPNADEVEGMQAYATLASVPASVDGVSIITPPEVTESVIEELIDLGIKNVWMQPGAENQRSVDRAREANVNVIAGGPCLLVVMGYREEN